MTTRVLVPSGALGLGFDHAALARGIAARPDIIAIDGGSTDSGPFSLGAGQSKYARAATRSEWRALMLARAEAAVPLVIGTCGTCGTDSTVDWMYDITAEIAAELGQSLKIARLYLQPKPDQRDRSPWHGPDRPPDPSPADQRRGFGPDDPYRRPCRGRAGAGSACHRCRYYPLRSHH